MRTTILCAALFLSATLLCSPVYCLPSAVTVESPNTGVTIDISDGNSLLKSITSKETGEAITFDAASSDFAIHADAGDYTRKDFKVTNVIAAGRTAYIVMDGPDLGVTQRFDTYDSGCVKRSLQIFAKKPVHVENVTLLSLNLNEVPSQTVNHNARFLQYAKGGFFLTVEMPSPVRDIPMPKDRILSATYSPIRSLKAGESMETVPVVFQSWVGDMKQGYETYRDYTYELSGWREYAVVRTSSERPTDLTRAYDGYKAADDDPTTRWQTKNDLSGKHWLEIEFPRPVEFNTMNVVFENEGARPALDKPTPFEEYHLQIWKGDGWEDVVTGASAPSEPVHFADAIAGKVRFLVDGCFGRLSVFDLRLYRDYGLSVIPENVCSRFWQDTDVRMPFTYFNTWYIRHAGVGRLFRARGLLTYDTVLPLIPLAEQCGLEHFVLDAGWKYLWSGVGLNPGWTTEFPNGEKPFVQAADDSGIDLAAWFYFFWLEGDKLDHQWRVARKDGKLERHMCILSGYYDFVKREMLHHIRNSHMGVMKIDGFVPPDECFATNHNHRPGEVRDAGWLAFMKMVEEIRRQYPDFRIGPYTWDSSWAKYSELIHTYEDHGSTTPGELAPTRAKANYMHDREMFNEAYWRYLVRNQVEGSAIIQDKTPEWREELIGNLAGPTRRQISTDLLAFSADERNWIRYCMNWSRKNAKYLEQFKPFFPNPKVTEPWGLQRNRGMEKALGVDVLESNTVEGYAHIFDNEGYIFIFNPTFHGAEYSIPISYDLGFTSTANGLSVQTIYPYFMDFSGKLRFGETFRGYLPAEKHIVIRVMKQPIPSLIPDCNYTANETIWDSVELTARAEPAARGGVLKTKLLVPKDTGFQELTVNGKPVAREADGSYDLSLQVPVRVSVNAAVKAGKVKDGKKATTANVTISGDLLQPSLMLYLYRGEQAKAAPGTFAHRLLVNGKEITGAYGESLEAEKDAGWWVYKLPSGAGKFTVTVESTDKVRPVLLLSAKQDWKEAAIVGKYARDGSNRGLLSKDDPEVFLHKEFPEEMEYFPIVDLAEE